MLYLHSAIPYVFVKLLPVLMKLCITFSIWRHSCDTHLSAPSGFIFFFLEKTRATTSILYVKCLRMHTLAFALKEPLGEATVVPTLQKHPFVPLLHPSIVKRKRVCVLSGIWSETHSLPVETVQSVFMSLSACDCGSEINLQLCFVFPSAMMGLNSPFFVPVCMNVFQMDDSNVTQTLKWF